VRLAIQSQKNKVPGIENVTAELIKYGGEHLAVYLHSLMLDIWIKEEIPE
jgi:hypothetical protein